MEIRVIRGRVINYHLYIIVVVVVVVVVIFLITYLDDVALEPVLACQASTACQEARVTPTKP